MLKKRKFKTRRLCLIASFFVLLIALSGCSSAGKPVGNLDKDATYLSAGSHKVTKGELWSELRWSASSVLTEKMTEVVMKDYVEKVELIMEKSYSELSEEQKKLFKEDFSNTDYEALKKSYEERLENYVIDDIYNFTFDSEESSYEKIKDVNTYEAKKIGYSIL